MHQYIIMCRSMTYAQRAAAALERSGITAAIARAPHELSENGCGYCLKISDRRFREAQQVLENKRLPCGRAFRAEPGGKFTEVPG